MKLIKDANNEIVGQIVDNGTVTYVRDGMGRPKGQYVKSADVTFDEKGRFFGRGDQMLPLLK